MGILVRRRKNEPSKFQLAADGSMTLMEHLRELRSRLFKAALAVVGGLLLGLIVAERVLNYLTRPYCGIHPDQACKFAFQSPIDPFLLNLRVALYIGLVIAAPFWLYQLWAFIAPGLHRNERKYTYAFVAIAAPLFLAGATLAHFVVAKSLKFFLGAASQYDVVIGLPGYFDFVTGMMLLFGAGFEFPLVVLMLNFAGVVSARKLLGWWRIAVFLMFVFGAVVTPTPDPFGMSILAGSMALLYFAAVGVAFLNDRRRFRNRPNYDNLSDDEVSSLDDYEAEPVEAGAPVDAYEPIAAPEPVAKPQPIDRRYDDIT
jgi:sec-independent protein translocase protein TatC